MTVSPRRQNAAVLAGFVLVSFLYFGLRLLPHPGRAILGTGRDPQIFIWSFAWWPHAIGNGLNPFVSHVVWAPDGINLAWTTSVPGLALLFAPLTVAFGPVVSFNVAAMLLPALAAWTAYLLCRHLTGRLWPSVAGGYLFGFSSYMLGQQLGHMHMTSVFLVPLVALVVLRYEGRALAWRLGALLALQITFSTELFFTVSFSLAVTLALGYATVPDARERLRALLRPLLGGYALAGLLASPLLLYALLDFERGSINEPRLFNGDLLNLVVPTHLVAAGGTLGTALTERFPGNVSEQGAYLGLPTLIVVGWFVARRRRFASGHFLAAALGVALLITLGTALWVGGHRLVPLPWAAIAQLPVFNNVLPVRFSLFASLAAAVVVALWSASTVAPRRARILLPALAVLALVPAAWHGTWRFVPDRPAFFAQGLYKVCFPRGESVAIFPYGYRSDSMLWQAESGFWFRMPQGYLRPDSPPGFLKDVLADPTIPEILDLAKRKDVDRILSIERYAHPNGTELEQIAPLQLLGGVLVSPACGHPSLAGA